MLEQKAALLLLLFPALPLCLTIMQKMRTPTSFTHGRSNIIPLAFSEEGLAPINVAVQVLEIADQTLRSLENPTGVLWCAERKGAVVLSGCLSSLAQACTDPVVKPDAFKLESLCSAA